MPDGEEYGLVSITIEGDEGTVEITAAGDGPLSLESKETDGDTSGHKTAE